MPTQTALITGASSGIGKEIAILLAKHGYNLILTARNAEMLQETANACKTHNIAVEAILADLAQESAPRQIVDEINAKNLQVDILVNNAGFGSIGRFTELELSRELEMVKVNVLALMSLTRLLLPRMLERQSGRILNVASMAGFVPGPLMATYYATKSFVVSHSLALRQELRKKRRHGHAPLPGTGAHQLRQKRQYSTLQALHPDRRHASGSGRAGRR